MYIAYMDEAGDDGFPKTRSDLFALSSVYMKYLDWQENYSKIIVIRKEIEKKFGLKVKKELHTKKLLENNDVYKTLKLDETKIIEILEDYCSGIAKLKLRVINCVTNKKKITRTKYNVLENCLKYSITRIENDLRIKKEPDLRRFLIIVDHGREGKMVKIARAIQKENFVKSKITQKQFDIKIKKLIEDPIAKNSRESHFIQISDFIVTLIYRYKIIKLGLGSIPTEWPKALTIKIIEKWLDMLLPILNTEACKRDKYGIVCYPY